MGEPWFYVNNPEGEEGREGKGREGKGREKETEKEVERQRERERQRGGKGNQEVMGIGKI